MNAAFHAARRKRNAPPEKPTVVITANTAWNVYSRRRLVRAIQNAGFETVCMGAVGSMTGTRTARAFERDDESPPRRAEKTKEDAYSRLVSGELGCAFIPLPMEGDGTNPFKDLRLFGAFIRAYKKLKPAAALHFNVKPDIYGSIAASLLSIPSFSNITGLGVTAEKSGFTAKLVHTLFRAAFASKKTFVFFQNKDDREYFLSRSLCRPEQTEVIPGSGVDTAFFTPDFGGSPGGRTDGTDTSRARFLFSGRLLTSKGCGDFLRAAEIVKAARPDASFDLVGEHDKANPIFIPESQLDRALEKGLAVWHGVTGDVRPFIKNAACVVLPSYYREGVPRVLLEAAAMGRALIAADCPGTREPVEDGVNGFLCRPADPEDLAGKMLAYLSLPETEKKRMGEASRSIAEKRFSDTIVADAYVKRLAECGRGASVCENL